jgi:agmatine deiminase
VLAAVEDDPADENYHLLQENLRRLQLMTDLAGRALTVLTMPMPPRIEVEGQRLPASHINFYIGNRVVLLPTFGGPSDAAAGELLRRCFPEREIVGLDSTDVVWGLGAWHCLTQQVPAV